MFTDEQKTELAAKLDGRYVKEREQAGRKFSYIEGWQVIAEANRIFGFDGWSRETIENRCIWEGTRTTRQGKELMTASYISKVRVTVRAGDQVIVREGTGAGSGMGTDGGEAHESAVKESETDAMKRAFMTFGNPFGLALYDKSQADVDRGGPPPGGQQRPRPVAAVERATPLRDARREMDAGTASTVPQGRSVDQSGDPKWWAGTADAVDFLRAARADLSLIQTGEDMSRWMETYRWEHDAIIEHGGNHVGKDGQSRTQFLNKLVGDTQDRIGGRAPNLRAAG